MRRFVTYLLMVSGVASCARGVDFRSRLESYEADSRLAADVARGCAVDLRALAASNAIETRRALDGRATRLVGRWITPESIWADIAREEREFEGTRQVLARAYFDGPAALDRVVAAVTRAHHVQDTLCRARDVATTLASTARPPRDGEAAVAAGASLAPR